MSRSSGVPSHGFGPSPTAAVPPPATAPGRPKREGNDLLLAREGASLPAYCVRRGERTDSKPIRQTFYWHHPGLYVLVLPGLLWYAIAAYLRKKAIVDLHLCEAHARSRRITIAAGALCALAPIVGWVVTPSLVDDDRYRLSIFIMLSVAVFLGGGLVAERARGILRPVKIDEQTARLRGAAPAFLEKLQDDLVDVFR